MQADLRPSSVSTVAPTSAMCTRRRACTRETRAVQRGVDQLDLAPGERGERRDRDDAGRGVDRLHVLRLGGGDAEAAALADREGHRALVPSQHGAIGGADLTGAQVDALAIEESPQLAAAQEADVLALGRGRRGQPRARGLEAHVLLVRVGERELEHAEQLGRHACEHRGLVLGGVGATRDERTVAVRHETRVVAGREPIGPESASRVGEQGDAEVAVAGGARVRGAPGLVVVEERR